MLLVVLQVAQAALTCDDVLLLVRSDVPRANILYTLTQTELEEGASECLLRKGVPMEYIEAAVLNPKPQPVAAPEAPPPEPATPSPAGILSQRVDVEVVGLQIGVSKTGGLQWDGSNTVASEKQSAVLGMAKNKVDQAAIATQVAEWGGSGKAPPDPMGFLELRGPSTPAAFRGKRLPFDKRGVFAKDTFTPRFTRSYGFRGITITEHDALQVTVQDMEFKSKETIGVAEIPFSGLSAAFDAQQVTPVFVGDQTNGQLLYVLITVRPSSISGKPEALGPLY